MKKEKLKAKAIVFSLLLAVLLPATTVSAQGILGSSLVDEYYEEQDRSMLHKGSGSISYGASTDQDGLTLGGLTQDDPSSPLGSGLIILAAAGAGYVLLKKKEEKA